MTTIPKLKIKGFEILHGIIQGGMGVGISRPRLTRAVFQNGGLGVLSSAGLKTIKSLETGKKYDTYKAVREEIETAMSGGYLAGINIMVRLHESFAETVRAALDAKVSAIFFGAGLPKGIPDPGDTAIIPIISSARALRFALRTLRPVKADAIVLEGPLAGGHLGFDASEISKPDFQLEKLLPEVLDVASKNGNLPVIPAGGIWDKNDRLKFLKMGASGVQMGTRFLAAKESGATNGFKQRIIRSRKEDIIVVQSSPCGFPFRILINSPMHREKRLPKCDLGYVLEKDSDGRYTVCKAHPNNPANGEYLCICNGLRAAIGLAQNEPPLYTVGSNAYRVTEILSVADLMKELTEG